MIISTVTMHKYADVIEIFDHIRIYLIWIWISVKTVIGRIVYRIADRKIVTRDVRRNISIFCIEMNRNTYYRYTDILIRKVSILENIVTL